MPDFHVLAVFEAGGSSPDEIQENVATLFDSLSHQRVRYYEHELSEGSSAPSSSGGRHYYMVFADFDVDAHTEDKAMDFAGDALDYISTDACQFLVLGIVPGKQRVQPKHEEARQSDQDERGGRRRSPRGRGRLESQEREAIPADPVREASEAARDEPADQDERGVRRRGPRGRGRGRRGRQENQEREVISADPALETPEAALSEPASQDEPVSRTNVVPLPESEVSSLEMEPSSVDAASGQAEQAGHEEEGASSKPPPPSRSSGSMRVTVTVKLRASELTDTPYGDTTAQPQDLIPQAIAEARRRNPEVPVDVLPESELTPLPGGDTLFSLTWKYAAAVPSAKDAS